MKKIVLLLLLTSLGSGCYTQIKSSGDYWGYSGRHHRAVLVESDTIRPEPPPIEQSAIDTTLPPPQDYSDLPPDNSGATIINNYYDVEPWGHPYWSNWGYYTYAPGVSFSISYGSPGWGYYDPYYYWYNDPWYWGYNYPAYYGFGYGCLVPPYYPHYFGYHHRYYLPDYGNHHYGNSSGNYRGTRRGRITGGEDRSGRSLNSGSGGRSYNRSNSTGGSGGSSRRSGQRSSQGNNGGQHSSSTNSRQMNTNAQPTERQWQPERSRSNQVNNSSSGTRTAPQATHSQSSSGQRSEAPRQNGGGSGSRSSGR